MPTSTPIDPATEPFLPGRFAPVHESSTSSTSRSPASLPDDLAGAYLRDGPNPEFPPLGSYPYPLEGDGMLHGVWFEGGRARYANRYVRTEGLRAEERLDATMLEFPRLDDRRIGEGTAT